MQIIKRKWADRSNNSRNPLHGQRGDATDGEHAANREHIVLRVVEVGVLLEEQDPVDGLDTRRGGLSREHKQICE